MAQTAEQPNQKLGEKVFVRIKGGWVRFRDFLERKQFNPIPLVSLTALAVIALVALVNIFRSEGGAIASILFHDPEDFFMDFFNSMADATYPKLFTEYQVLYAAIMYIPLDLIVSVIPGNEYMSSKDLRNSQVGILAFFMIFVFFLIAFAALLYREKKGSRFERIAFVLLMYLSMGMITVMERGNLILVALFFSAMFLAFYRSERWWVKEIAYVCLALAVCIKIYPVFLGILILKEKHYTGAMRCFVYWLVLFVTPFLYYGNMAENILAYFKAVLNYGTSGPASSPEAQAAIDELIRSSDTRMCSLILMAQNVDPTRIPCDDVVGTTGYSFTGTLQVLFLVLYSNYTTLELASKISTALVVFVFLFCFLQDRPWKTAVLTTLLSLTFSSGVYTYSTAFLIFPFLMFLNDSNPKNILHWIYALLFVCIFGVFTYAKEKYALCPYWYMPFYDGFTLYNLIERFAVLIFAFLLSCEGLFRLILYVEDLVVKLLQWNRKRALRKARSVDPYGRSA